MNQTERTLVLVDMERIGLTKKMILGSILVPAATIGFTFALAGRIDYWQGWVYNLLNLTILGLTYVALSDRKDLIQERLKPGKGMKRWDKIYYIVSSPTYFIAIAIACLDAGRFHWEPHVPLAIIILGIVIYCAGQLTVLWAKRVNRFFSSVVRIQTDRGQTVCREGAISFREAPRIFRRVAFLDGHSSCSGFFLGSDPHSFRCHSAHAKNIS